MATLVSLLTALVLVIGFAVPGSASTAASSDLVPFSKYEEPVTITVGRMGNTGGQFAPGQDAQNNAWTQMLRDELNIIIDVENGFDVDASEYENMLALRAASNTLPDTFSIPNTLKSLALFNQLLEGNKLADLTEAYKNVIGGKTKEYLDSLNTEEILQFMTFDNILYGLTGGREGYNTALLWVRQDWLDKLGLEVPQTLEDIEKVALAFVEKKPGGNENTIGIALNPYAPDGMFGQWMGILPVFNAAGSYPDIWVEDESGKAVWGGIQPETKEALAVLADWYQKGVLDKNLVTMKNGDEVRDTYLSTNGCGMIFNAWWDPWVQWDGLQDTSVKNNEGVVWVPVMAPLNAQGKFSPKNETVTPGGQVVLASCEHPEAIIKALNLIAEVDIFRNPDFEHLRQKYIVPVEGLTDARTNSPFNNQMVQLQNRIIVAENINDYKTTGTLNLDPRVANDKDYIQGAYDWINNNTMAEWYAARNDEEVDKYMFQYVGHLAHDTVGNLYLEGEKSGLYVEKVQSFVGTVDAHTDYGAMISDLQYTAFIQIISGEKPLDYFDTFVAEWERLGGGIITDQVNEALGK